MPPPKCTRNLQGVLGTEAPEAPKATYVTKANEPFKYEVHEFPEFTFDSVNGFRFRNRDGTFKDDGKPSTRKPAHWDSEDEFGDEALKFEHCPDTSFAKYDLERAQEIWDSAAANLNDAQTDDQFKARTAMLRKATVELEKAKDTFRITNEVEKAKELVQKAKAELADADNEVNRTNAIYDNALTAVESAKAVVSNARLKAQENEEKIGRSRTKRGRARNEERARTSKETVKRKEKKGVKKANTKALKRKAKVDDAVRKHDAALSALAQANARLDQALAEFKVATVKDKYDKAQTEHVRATNGASPKTPKTTKRKEHRFVEANVELDAARAELVRAVAKVKELTPADTKGKGKGKGKRQKTEKA